MHKIDFDKLPWVATQPGMRCKLWRDTSDSGVVQQMRLVELNPSFVEADWCLKAHAGLVLEGSLEIDFQGRIETFTAGDGLAIRAGDGHKARAVTTLVRFILFEREDHLAG